MSFCMCKHFSNTNPTTCFKEILHEKSNWQFWVGCGHWDIRTCLLFPPCYWHMWLGKYPMLVCFIPGHPKGLYSQEGHALAGQHESEKCFSPMSSNGSQTQSTWFSVVFLSQDLQYSMSNILQFTQFWPLCDSRREILKEIRESLFLSDLKHMFLWLDFECG